MVLIERGSEVGGGDVRTDVGTVGPDRRGRRSSPTAAGRVAAVGTRRLRVARWLADDPYPRAEVEDWPDGPDGPDEAAAAPRRSVRGEVTALLRQVLALAAELGEAAPPADLELADDPALAGFQAAAVAPLGPADRRRCWPPRRPRAPHRRCSAELLDGEVELLEARLSAG